MRRRLLACLAVAPLALGLAGPALGLELPPPVEKLIPASGVSGTSKQASSSIQPGGSLPGKPVIERAPSKIVYGRRFTITVQGEASGIAKVVLVQVPDASNPSQELTVELPVLGKSGHGLTVQAPMAGGSAPTGRYLLILEAIGPAGLIRSDPVEVLLGAAADLGVQPPTGVVGPGPSVTVRPTAAPTRVDPVLNDGMGAPTPAPSEGGQAGGETRQDRPAALKLPNGRPFLPIYPLMPIVVAIAFILTAMGLRRIS
jgi:hypothetical protein